VRCRETDFLPVTAQHASSGFEIARGSNRGYRRERAPTVERRAVGSLTCGRRPRYQTVMAKCLTTHLSDGRE
jgi:hypothetical protein